MEKKYKKGMVFNFFKKKLKEKDQIKQNRKRGKRKNN